jgi:acetylornithine deacetylase/succinyl-diaminopimelate desuccinylase-like protein
MNILKIEGGQEEVMLVPDRCRLVIDRCLVPGYSSEQALTDLKTLILDHEIDAEAKLIERETPFCEPFELPSDNPHVQLTMSAASRVLGVKPEISYHEGPCDSCILVSEGKIPAIEFGPTGGKLHECEEYVEIESVMKASEVYMEILRTALG